jgi:Ca-activated chloride channel homolog
MRIECSSLTPVHIIFVVFALVTSLSGGAGGAHVSAITGAPQQPNAPSPSTDQTAKFEVLVLDNDYQPVKDMKPEDFHLALKNQEVKIDSAQFNASGALNFALLFDFSGSRKDDLRFRKEFAEAGDFLRRIWQAGDVATVVAFNDLPHRAIYATQNLDAAVGGLDSLARLSPKGGTALYDAICSVAIDRNSMLPLRKAILIFSDFNDDSSRNTTQQGIECAWKGRVSIYSFFILDKNSDQRETKHGLKTAWDLSEQSGGVAFNAKSASDFSESLSQLSQFLRSSYEITFTPPLAKLGKDPVSIDVKTTRPGVKLYFARSYDEE